MRRVFASSMLLVFLTLQGGCDQGVPAPAVPAGTTTGPHGGIALPLPDGAGYAEILIEREASSKGKVRSARPRLAVFFLNPDRSGPLAPPPSEVQAKVALPTGTTSSLPLTASPISGDAAGSARYVSEPGDLDYDELSGELTVTLGGQASSIPFAMR